MRKSIFHSKHKLHKYHAFSFEFQIKSLAIHQKWKEYWKIKKWFLILNMKRWKHKKLAKCNIFEIKIYCLQKNVSFKKYAIIQTHMCLKEINIKVNFINVTSDIWCIYKRYKKQDIKSKQHYVKFFNIILFKCCFKALFSLKKKLQVFIWQLWI